MFKILFSFWATVNAIGEADDEHKANEKATILGIIKHWVDVESHNQVSAYGPYLR